MCDVRDQMLDGFFGGDSRFCSCTLRNQKKDGWMSAEQSLTNTDTTTTYYFLEESYYTTRLLIFFIHEITKSSAKNTHQKSRKIRQRQGKQCLFCCTT